MTTREAVLLGWCLVGSALLACQLLAVASRGTYPGFGALLRRLGAGTAGRAALLLAWAWLGWHAFAR